MPDIRSMVQEAPAILSVVRGFVARRKSILLRPGYIYTRS
jgi:hypothetical protein